MDRITQRIKYVVTVSAVFLIQAGILAAVDMPVPVQPIGNHSTLSTSDGSIRDDDLAEAIGNCIPKDPQTGDPLVKDVKIMVNSCYGGGLLDDITALFAAGGPCAGVPWVAGSAATAEQCAFGWSDSAVNAADNQGLNLGSTWTQALAGSQTVNGDAGAIQDGTSGNVFDDLQTAGTNDDSGPNYDNSENPVVGHGNGGDAINWTAPNTSHVALVFGGSQSNDRHHNNIENVFDALAGVWKDDTYVIIPMDGGTTAALLKGISAACAGLDENTELALYFDDHGNTEFDVDELWELINGVSFPILDLSQPLDINIDLHQGWVQGLTAMNLQPSDSPHATLDIDLLNAINLADWTFRFNNQPMLPQLGFLLPGKHQIPLNWQLVQTGLNRVEIFTTSPTASMQLADVQVHSGHINEIEKGGYQNCGDELHTRPVGDFNGNCTVNIEDAAIFFSNWLSVTFP
jgi:hypothetical protein